MACRSTPYGCFFHCAFCQLASWGEASSIFPVCCRAATHLRWRCRRLVAPPKVKGGKRLKARRLGTPNGSSDANQEEADHDPCQSTQNRVLCRIADRPGIAKHHGYCAVGNS